MGDDGLMSSSSVPRKGAQVALLANPAARRGRAAADIGRVLERLRFQGIEPLVLDSSSADEARMAAHHAVETGIPRLVAVGGDGIVHMAAHAAAGSPTIVGIVAAGTGNDAAEALGLTGDLPAGGLDARVDRALTDPTPVDLLACHSGRNFEWVDGDDRPLHAVTSCVAGFPALVNARAEAMRMPRGPSRYTLATLGAIPRMRPGRFRLTLSGGPDDGVVVDQPAAVVVVANTGLFGGGMRICPDARPDDGLLDVCLVGDVGRLALLRAFPKVRTGAHLNHPDVTTYRSAAVRLETVESEGASVDPAMRADGEPFTTLPATITVRPGALLVAGARTRAPGRETGQTRGRSRGRPNPHQDLGSDA